MTDQPETGPPVIDDWEARLRVAVEQTLTARAARRNLRNDLAARRSHGLAARHAAKEARNQGTGAGHHPADERSDR